MNKLTKADCKLIMLALLNFDDDTLLESGKLKLYAVYQKVKHIDESLPSTLAVDERNVSEKVDTSVAFGG